MYKPKPYHFHDYLAYITTINQFVQKPIVDKVITHAVRKQYFLAIIRIEVVTGFQVAGTARQ